MNSVTKHCKYTFKALALFVGLLLCAQSYAGQYVNKETQMQNIEHVKQAYQWFATHSPKAPHEKTKFTKEDVAKYFTEDAKMVTNGKLVCEGIEEHFDHFIELQDHVISMQPSEFNSIEANGDKVWLHYTIDVEKRDHSKETILVMGYMTLKDGKISHFEEVIFHA